MSCFADYCNACPWGATCSRLTGCEGCIGSYPPGCQVGKSVTEAEG